jgi:hypothetical protein
MGLGVWGHAGGVWWVLCVFIILVAIVTLYLHYQLYKLDCWVVVVHIIYTIH